MSFYRVKFLFKVGYSDFVLLFLLKVCICNICRTQILKFCTLSVIPLKNIFVKYIYYPSLRQICSIYGVYYKIEVIYSA